MTPYLQSHWLALLLLGIAGLWLVLCALRRSRLLTPALVPIAGLMVLGVGGTGFLGSDAAMWLAIASATMLFAMLVFVVVSGQWWAPAGYALLAILLVGIGGWGLPLATRGVNEAAVFVSTLRPLAPLWLILLLLLPLIVFFSFRSLAGLGPVRRWLALGLRSGLLLCLILALADTHAVKSTDRLTVLFLWDRSLSIPGEFEKGIDAREERIRDFINKTVIHRGPGREKDRAGLIVFGRYPRLELPPESVAKLPVRTIHSPIDGTYTDIAAAIKLALASFPEDTGKRIVLFSDGNQNLGNAEEQARIARQNGVQIDVVPLTEGRRLRNEVMVERVEAPPTVERAADMPVRVVLRSYNPDYVVGKLELYKTHPVRGSDLIVDKMVRLPLGLRGFDFQVPGSKEEDAFAFEAKFVPLRVEREDGTRLQDGLAGDRIENNRASTNVVARGQRYVLLLEPNVGDHQLLVERLEKAKTSLRIVPLEPGRLPQDPGQLGLFLSKFDAVVLANIPAESLSETQQKMLAANTHDQGCGLVMIGGPHGFGAGGWQGTEIEKALPVTADLKDTKIEIKGGLVLMMHASEMAEGNAWQKKIAKLAIQKLSPMDMVGVLYWNGQHVWHVPFQAVGGDRGRLLGLVDSMNPGDMPDVDPALDKAHEALTNPLHRLGTRLIIFISDGDHWRADPARLVKLRDAKIPCSTVCITTHGQEAVEQMKQMARATGGRDYFIKKGDEDTLPAIYMKETRNISKSFIHDKQFNPRLVFSGGPTEGITALEPLHGFVRTMRRPLTEVPIETPELGKEEKTKYPILAYWQHGLGKSVAFTSDALAKEKSWDRDWAKSAMHAPFWEQTVDWALRATEKGGHLTLLTEVREGKVRVTVEARDSDKRPLTEVKFTSAITSPPVKQGEPRRRVLRFEQTNSGVYEAECAAEDVGAYFINVVGKWKTADGRELAESIRGGVVIPYSPEFAELESHGALLEKLREITGGKSYDDESGVLASVARTGEVFRPLPASHQGMQPIWPALLVIAGVLLFFDVAVRRIAIDPLKVAAGAEALWSRLRGRAVVEIPQYLERLRSRKAQVGEAIDQGKAARRFEGEEEPIGTPPAAGAAPAAPPEPRRPEKSAPPPAAAEEAEDYASRLLRAKKKAMEERDRKT